MKKILLLLIVFAMMTSVVFANGLSLNSIGPKGFGMGGAFIGLANDPTAIYWNPAGLVGQQTGISLFTTDVIPFATFKNETFGIDAKTNTNHYISPNLFVNYNLGKFGLGFGAYVPAGLGAEWNGADLKAYNEDPSAEFEWMSEIGVFNFSPAFAYNFYQKFNVGVAANIYYGMLKMKKPEDMNQNQLLDTQTEFDIAGMGYGFTVSMKWKCFLTDKLDLGLTYRSPINVAFEGDAVMGATYDAEMDIEWPAWYGFGAALVPNEKLTLTLDAQYSNWASLEKLIAKIKDMPNPQGGTFTYEKEMHLNWEDAVQIRIGSEYKINDLIAARLGYYYDPAPAPDETLNILFPSSTNHVITTGFGITKNKFSCDFGIEYLLGGERKIEDQDQTENNMVGTHQMDTFAFSFGLGYKF
ncbi:MAG: hypothetical protein DRZ79_06440 [Candidatus Cloacimonadota bacterium]|nr:MAG: hypothetical protein DRZ79_06440 [Candidatus Cloacimonadota bacterium]